MVKSVFAFKKWRSVAADGAAFFVPKLSHVQRTYIWSVSLLAALVAGVAHIGMQDTKNSSASISVESDASAYDTLVEELPSDQEGESVTVQTESITSTTVPTETQSTVRVQIKSSQSVQGSVQSEQTITQEVNGREQTITKDDQNGSASVRYQFSAGPNAEVEVRERNGRIKIDVKEDKSL